MKYLYCILVLFLPLWLCAQQNLDLRPANSLRVCFYNVENLYDCQDDTLTADENFTPEGSNYWTPYRFYAKIQKLAKVIVALGQWRCPELVGLCEVENAFVLSELIEKTPLHQQGYTFVHYDSPDRRGIDVALLYREGFFEVYQSRAIEVCFPFDTTYKTRDILYVKGGVPHLDDTLHIFINHWTSRYGGLAQTMAKRNYLATFLRQQVDSILAENPSAKILCMGDFNDYPENESIVDCFRAESPQEADTTCFVHAMYPYFKQNNVGTHKYQKRWGILDQILLSPSLFSAQQGFKSARQAIIFSADFLLEPDVVHLGQKPFRTYLAMRYLGGFSDHLPVYIDIFY